MKSFAGASAAKFASSRKPAGKPLLLIGEQIFDPVKGREVDIRGIDIFLPDALVNFFAMDFYLRRCLDADPDLFAFDVHDGDGDVITDLDPLADLARQNKHTCPTVWLCLSDKVNQ